MANKNANQNIEIDNIETRIESEAIYDFVKVAISKKIEKMQRVSECIHMWYTHIGLLLIRLMEKE